MSNVYSVTRAKVDSSGQKHFQNVGTLVLRDDGNGVLFLNHLDGDFPIFKKAPQSDGPGSESPPENAGYRRASSSNGK